MNPRINFIFNKILVIDTTLYTMTQLYMHQHRAICTNTELYAPTPSYMHRHRAMWEEGMTTKPQIYYNNKHASTPLTSKREK